MYSIRLEGDVRKLMKKLSKLEDVDIKGTALSLAEALRESTRERFKKAESPDGKKWKTSIRASEQGGTTLTDSAALKNSIRSKADGSGFAVGTNKIYARTHQFGDKRTIKAKNGKSLRFQVGGKWATKKQVKVTIPKRPFLGISKDDMQEIRSTLEEAVEKD